MREGPFSVRTPVEAGLQAQPNAHGVLLDPADRMLLASVRQALAVPFRDPVRVSGQLMPRKLARTIERGLAKLQVLERRGCGPFAVARIAAAVPVSTRSHAAELRDG
jgi:hypothetical protein